MAQVIDNTNTAPPAWERLGTNGAFIGGVALLGLIIGSLLHLGGGSERMFFQAYMYGWIFWMAITLGCFILQLLTNITRATWGFPVLRLFEAGAKMLPIMALLGLPIVYNVFFSGINSIYPWADITLARADDKMWHRYGYMNPAMWVLRYAIFFFIWSALAWLLARMSSDQDRTRDASIIQTRVNWASVGFCIFIMTGTFAYVDWVMSLDPHWYSTIYAAWYLAGSALTALVFIATLVLTQKLQRHPVYSEVVTVKVVHDWGNLMITLVMVWAYFSVSQFIITWSGNLPEEITYYIQRNNGTTAYITTFLVIAMFFGPFICLLSPRAKRTPAILRSIAIWLLGVRVLESFWNIVPFFPRNLHTELVSQLNWGYLWALFGIGGLWMYGFFALVRRSPLLTVEDLVIAEEAVHAA